MSVTKFNDNPDYVKIAIFNHTKTPLKWPFEPFKRVFRAFFRGWVKFGLIPYPKKHS